MKGNVTGQKRIKITVNDKEIEVYSGLTVLQALIQEGIHIPHLCYDIRLTRANGNCGLCEVELKDDGRSIKSCQTPVMPGMNIVTSSPRLEAYRKVRMEQLLSDHNADCVAPCALTCPAGIDIQTFLQQVEAGNFTEALRGIKESNPFPSVCGRICPRPCETQCRRNLVDSPVAINYVKRFVADWDMEKDMPFVPRCSDPTGKRIAIVGAGPSGLSAAYYSAINGHDVTVFERHPCPGGMMRYGIPEYRLPKAVLDKEIEVITRLGVKITCGKNLGTHIRLEDLHHDFDAVYLAIGSWLATPLGIEGENCQGVWLGINFLEHVIKDNRIDIGKRVVVIGGGNTAIDCARTALRMGAEDVKLIYRRTRDEMPAQVYEIEEAIREGVEIIFLTAPLKITSSGGQKSLHLIKMRLGEPDRSGRRRPIPVDNSEFILEADTVIGAIGQSTNTQFLYNDLPVRLNKWGDIEVNGYTMQTSADNVFAGGDCVTGPATVVQAVGAGRHAAIAMHTYLTKGYVREQHLDYSCSRGTLEDLPRWEFENIPRFPRAEMPSVPVAKRRDNFKEVETGLSGEIAREEAGRCLRCGCFSRLDCDLRKEAGAHGIQFTPPIHERPFFPIVDDHPFIIRDHNKCISCGRCIAACAEIEGPGVLSYYLKQGRMLVGTRSGRPLQDTDCVSCGQCVTACPCGALDYRREQWVVYRALHNPQKTVVGFVAPAVRSVISTKFGIPFDQASAFIAGILKRLGFDKVFDFSFAADLTIMEETTEFLKRIERKGVMPQFTSCCPGWVNFVERRYPELIPYLSTCKSPQQMMGATVKSHFSKWSGIPKEDLYVVSIVPCLAKKAEAARPEFGLDGVRDVDSVITSMELLEMMSVAHIKEADEIIPAEFDEPYRQVTGAGILFGASGGVAEAALRMAVEKITGRPLKDHLDFEEVRGFEAVKEAEVTAGGKRLRVAVISGLHNVEPTIEKILNGTDVGYDLIEVMACPGGCICGAGHPVPEKIDTLEERQQILINIDKTSRYRKSQENPDILRLYTGFYTSPNSELARRLLHTSYTPRKVDMDIRRMEDSAFKTSEITVCICDSCTEKGARAFYEDMKERLKRLKLADFVMIKPLRMKYHTSDSDIYITFDNRHVSEEQLEKLLKLARTMEPDPSR